MTQAVQRFTNCPVQTHECTVWNVPEPAFHYTKTHTHTLYHPLHPIRSLQHVFQTHLTDGLPLQHSPSPISHPVVFTLNHITHFTTQRTNTPFKHSFSSNDLPQQPAIKPPTCTHNCFAQTEHSTTADGSACTPA
jgi:hypothetical protein